MTDELVKRHVEQLRLTGGDLADLCQPLANAIEYLIAERDAADALIEAQAKDHASNNIRFAEAEHRAEAAEAERDRLRKALTEWDALIEHQYSGSREAMSAMTSVAQKTAKLLKGKSNE